MRLTPDEKLAWVERWKGSGMSARKFALSNGLRQNSFLKWSKGEAIDDRRNSAARRQFAELRNAGHTPWKIALALGIAYENCRRWERERKAGTFVG